MNNENYFTHNEACPRCRERGNDKQGDNLGVYSDGHANCWSCGFFRSSSIDFSRRVRTPTKDPVIKLPADTGLEYLQQAVNWMAKYDLTNRDMLLNGCLWSDGGMFINIEDEKVQCKDLLIFPLWVDLELMGYICRYFGDDRRVPKWITRGKLNEIYHILSGNMGIDKKKTVILTEDIVSAMKLSKVGHEAMPVFGIQAKSRFKLLKILGYTEVILWLDPDMHMQMIKQSRVGMLEGLQMRVILSTKDPKAHSFNEIEEYLK